MVENTVLIDLQQVFFAYPGGRNVLSGLDFQLRAGEKIGIVGSNGCGKTTFLHLLMGLIAPQAGRIRLFGEEMREKSDLVRLRPRLGLLFQDADDQLFSPTVLEDVAFGPLNMGKNVRQAKALAGEVLARLGIGGLAERITYQLSGGEKRMVALATVLVMEPEVLLLDEPTTGLDESTRARITEVLTGLDQACVVISHEYDFLVTVADRVCCMQDGRIIIDDGEVVHNHFHVHRLGGYPHQHPH